MKTYYVNMNISVQVQVRDESSEVEAFKAAKSIVGSLLGADVVRNVSYGPSAVHRAMNERNGSNGEHHETAQQRVVPEDVATYGRLHGPPRA